MVEKRPKGFSNLTKSGHRRGIARQDANEAAAIIYIYTREDAEIIILRRQEQHANYNKMLNRRVEETVARDYQFAPVRYKHVVLIDEFYPGGSGTEKIRVTRDKSTGQVVESLAKRRVANLEITSPKRKVDWRISVNVERPIGVWSGRPPLR
jgi:hypothetical protein